MLEEEYTIPEMVDEVREGKMERRQFMKRLTIMGVSAAGVGLPGSRRAQTIRRSGWFSPGTTSGLFQAKVLSDRRFK